MRLPDPALVVLVGASGSGKSTWATGRYRTQEIVSSDALRGDRRQRRPRPRCVDRRVRDPRAGRRGADRPGALHRGRHPRSRRRYVGPAGSRSHGRPGSRRSPWCSRLPTLSAGAATRRATYPCRHRPSPASSSGCAAVAEELTAEGWEVVIVSTRRRPAATSEPTADPAPRRRRAGDRRTVGRRRGRAPGVAVPLGRRPGAWLTDVAMEADRLGFAGIAVMDHLIQIPQVGRAWESIPEPYVTLGLLAGLDTGLRLGTLVTPMTLRPAGVVAKAVATLDALSGGRAFVGVGAGWWEREHAGFGVPFPGRPGPSRPARGRHRDHARALVAGHEGVAGHPGGAAGDHQLPPAGRTGAGDRRRLRRAADAPDRGPARRRAATCRRIPAVLAAKVAVLHAHCADVGRDPARRRDHGAGPAGRSARIATTPGDGWSGCAAGRLRRRTPPGTTPDLRATMSSGTPPWPVRASRRCSSGCRT